MLKIRKREWPSEDRSLVTGHLCEGLLQLLSDGLVLLLLGDELILQPVHLEEETIMKCSEKEYILTNFVDSSNYFINKYCMKTFLIFRSF